MSNPEDIPDFCCPICFSCYSERGTLPRMLKCGHTHCTYCLSNLIRSQTGKCGECRKIIDYNDAKSIPVNYSLLRLKEAMKPNNGLSNDFKEAKEKINKMIECLNETEKLYNIKVSDNFKELQKIEADKKNLQDLQKSINADISKSLANKSLNESFSIIKGIKDKLEELDVQNLIIKERLNRGRDLNKLQPILDRPAAVCIKLNALRATCFVSGNKIYMYSFCPNMPEGNKYEIDYGYLQPFFVGAFMVMKYNNRQVKLEFEVLSKNLRAKQFLEICKGIFKHNYNSATFKNHDRKRLEGESAVLGFNEAEKSAAPNNNFNKFNGQFDIRKGHLEGLGNDKSKGSHFRIYFEDWPSCKSRFVFGRMVQGTSILKSVLSNQYEATIVSSGIIFDPSIERLCPR